MARIDGLREQVGNYVPVSQYMGNTTLGGKDCACLGEAEKVSVGPAGTLLLILGIGVFVGYIAVKG